MKILALTRYGRMGASSRLRFEQYIPFLKDMQIDVVVSPLLGDDYISRLNTGRPVAWHDVLWRYSLRLTVLCRARKYDLLWIEKELYPNLPAWFEYLLALVGVRYVVDYDDAIFHQYDRSVHPLKKALRHKIDHVMHNASTVVCGNGYLAERAVKAGARKVVIIPTVIDLRRYELRDHVPAAQCVIGWIGSPTTSKYLDVVAPALRALIAEFSFRFVVIGATYQVADVQVDCMAWSEQTEVAQISTFDIGIMPLHDSPWEQGKCGYKLIQYMACGRPVIASPVGVNIDIVENGVNGYLASSTAEWTAALRKLLESAATRQRLGEAGRLLVEEQFTVQKKVTVLAETLWEAKGAA